MLLSTDLVRAHIHLRTSVRFPESESATLTKSLTSLVLRSYPLMSLLSLFTASLRKISSHCLIFAHVSEAVPWSFAHCDGISIARDALVSQTYSVIWREGAVEPWPFYHDLEVVLVLSRNAKESRGEVLSRFEHATSTSAWSRRKSLQVPTPDSLFGRPACDPSYYPTRTRT